MDAIGNRLIRPQGTPSLPWMAAVSGQTLRLDDAKSRWAMTSSASSLVSFNESWKNWYLGNHLIFFIQCENLNLLTHTIDMVYLHTFG